MMSQSLERPDSWTGIKLLSTADGRATLVTQLRACEDEGMAKDYHAVDCASMVSNSGDDMAEIRKLSNYELRCLKC